MHKISDLATAIVDKYSLSPQDAEHFVASMFEVIDEALQNGEKQVKIKGLGTFKLISVSSRESVNVNTGKRIVIEGRNKISFIPETSLKDRVNQPFGQFDTVVINDGVDFSEIDNEFGESADKDDDTEEPDCQSVEASDDNAVDVAPTEELLTTASDDAVSPGPQSEAVDDSDNSADEMIDDTFQQVNGSHDSLPETPIVPESETTSGDDNNGPIVLENVETEETIMRESPRWTTCVLFAMIVIMFLAGTYGAYYYQKSLTVCNNRIQKLESVISKIQSEQDKRSASSVVNDSLKAVSVPQVSDTLSMDANASPKKNVQKQESVWDASKYDKDPRIRTGAYRITGIAKTVKIGRGQTLKSISKMYLGPDMECYMEAVNDKAEYKEGDSVNVPKLKLKRRKANQ